MKLTLRAVHKAPTFTISELFIDDRLKPECLILEDAVRERPGVPVSAWKVQDETAIPSGTYKVVLSRSTRFKRVLPEILNVPGFSGIRIHPGNHSGDTEGCLLPGVSWNGKSDWVTRSRDAFAGLFNQMQAAWNRGEPISIEVKR